MDSQCPGWIGQAVLTLRSPCVIVESPRRHKHVPFVNNASLHSRPINRRQWKQKLNYYGVIFAYLATECGINAKVSSRLESDRWIPHPRCCENPARAKAFVGFSRHLSAGFTDLNPALGVFRYRCHLSVLIYSHYLDKESNPTRPNHPSTHTDLCIRSAFYWVFLWFGTGHFNHILRENFPGPRAYKGWPTMEIVGLLQCQWSNLDGRGKLIKCIKL